MRPKILEIEGLQSFRDKQVIDFETLGETGLFGIFGPTGSGKSTVLDAITFALYGRVKRAERGTQGIININMDTARVAFSFELQKDGGRRTYRVERTYQRKKGSENSCEPKVARLIEVTIAGDIPVCDKASEIGNSIEELIGLNHDDFTRAVVLPQNSFQEFLLLDNSKKRDMLERIFYLEEYGKQLWDKLSRKMSELKSRLDVLSGELAGYSDANDEALKEAEKSLDTALKERVKVEKELKQLETGYNEARDVWQLVGELSLVVNREMEHNADKAGIDEKRILLDRAVKADGLRELLSSVKDMADKLQETGKQMEEVTARLPDIYANLEQARSRYEKNRVEAALKQPEMVERRAKLNDALTLKAEITEVMKESKIIQENLDSLKNEISLKNKNVENAVKELELLDEQIKSLNGNIDSIKISPEYRQQIQKGFVLENEVASIVENVKEIEFKLGGINTVTSSLEQKLNVTRSNVDALQKKLDVFTEEKQRLESSTNDDRPSLQKEKDDINVWQTVYGTLKLRKSAVDSMKSKISLKQSNLKEIVNKAQKLQRDEAESKSKLEEYRIKVEDKTKEIDKNIAYRLSKNLKDGEPCPVCGSEHHPGYITHFDNVDLPEFEKDLEHMKVEYASLESVYKKSEKEALVAVEQVNSLTAQINQELQELDVKTGEYESEKVRLPEALSFQELERTGIELTRIVGDIDERLKALDKRDKSLEICNANIQELNDSLINEKKLEYGLITEIKVNKENKELYEKNLNELKGNLDSKQKMYSDFTQMYGISSANKEISHITENDRKMEVLQKQVTNSREKLTKDRNTLEKLKEELQMLNNENIKKGMEASNLHNRLDERKIKLRELAGDIDINGEIIKINKKLEEYSLLERQYQENIKSLEKQYNELIGKKTSLEKQQEIYSSTFQSGNTRLKAMLQDKGFTDNEEVYKSILSQEQQKVLKEQISEFDQEGNNIQAQKGMTLGKLNSRSITEEEWSEIDNRYKYMCTYKEECVSKSEVAKSSFNILKMKHDKWVELNSKHKELTDKFGIYATIQKLLRAEHGKDNSFIDFIAEERLRYVAAKASETLGFMTKYKYALELDTNAGFIICDNSNGGVHRMITSLSGGETFLTSLSLALALSEQIQLKGQSPLEFFFLDEGFGTLDNDLLETVIDSLERLSSKERVIGLISHVPELRNRIARRLVIEPPSIKGDGSKVEIEKA